MSGYISTERSFKRVLRNHGYYYVRTGDDGYMFIKHDERIGGIYFELGNKAKMRLESIDMKYTFNNRNELNSFLTKMENELQYLSPKLAKTLNRTEIKKILQKIIKKEKK